MTFLFRSQFLFSFDLSLSVLGFELSTCAMLGRYSVREVDLLSPPSLFTCVQCLPECMCGLVWGTRMYGCTCIGICVYLGLKLMLDMFFVFHPARSHSVALAGWNYYLDQAGFRFTEICLPFPLESWD